MPEVITIEHKILKKNADVAAENRRAIDRRGLFAVSLVSAPGSGKTSLLERTLAALRDRGVRAAVIEGDVQTDRDARRIAVLGVPVVQIVTNGTCHLEAGMVRDALAQLPGEIDLLFVENVGNLVCPASYDLGEHRRVVLTSTPEGDDKPLKYPAVFRNADALIINKVDLLPHVRYDVAQAKAFAGQVRPGLMIFETSCVASYGIVPWVEWLLAERRQHLSNCVAAAPRSEERRSATTRGTSSS
jgi:hydrogenase nickel incorporation protein HypB